MKFKVAGRKYKKTSQMIVHGENRQPACLITVTDTSGDSEYLVGQSSDCTSTLRTQIREATTSAELLFKEWKMKKSTMT